MKFNKTKLAVTGFTLALVAFFAYEAEADVHVGVGGGTFNSKGQVSQVLGFTHADRWGVDYERIGNGDDETVNAVSVYRRVYARANKGLRPYLELGASYFDEKIINYGKSTPQPFVDEHLTFHLGAGISYQLNKPTAIHFRARHNSVAGRVKTNTGLDRVELSFSWRI